MKVLHLIGGELTGGAAKGAYTDLKGKDPLPSYLYGDNFAED